MHVIRDHIQTEAGNRIQTDDSQLGKVTPYHRIMPAIRNHEPCSIQVNCTCNLFWYPEPDLNRHAMKAPDFESGASTNSAIRACFNSVTRACSNFTIGPVFHQSYHARQIQTGWGGWIRTRDTRHQKPLPYHLATPHQTT